MAKNPMVWRAMECSRMPVHTFLLATWLALTQGPATDMCMVWAHCQVVSVAAVVAMRAGAGVDMMAVTRAGAGAAAGAHPTTAQGQGV